jgi:hypothetical protein
MSPNPAAINEPKHPLHALTTFELSGYRRELERAIAGFDTKNPSPTARADLQTRLDALLAEQDDRVRLAAIDAELAGRADLGSPRSGAST